MIDGVTQNNAHQPIAGAGTRMVRMSRKVYAEGAAAGRISATARAMALTPMFSRHGIVGGLRRARTEFLAAPGWMRGDWFTK